MSRPLYEAVLRTTGIGKNTAVLDVGCGAGLFCALAALLAIAKERVPHGDFREGEMEALPYQDRTFEIVTGFNAFQFAAHPAAALAEARRLRWPKPGG